LDTTKHLVQTYERKKQKVSKDTQTKNFKGVHKRIVYDYGYGEG